MKAQKYKHEFDYSYALGMTITIELLKFKPQYTKLVYIRPNIDKNENYNALMEMCEKHNIPVETSEKAFNILSPKGNCFVIGVFDKFQEKLDKTSHVVLVNPSDAGNMGTIIRTAVGFGLDNLAIVRPAVDIFDPKVVRASMGAVFHVKFRYYDSYNEYRNEFSDHNLYPFMLRVSTPITKVEFKKPYSLVFGNEASGLPDNFADLPNTSPVVIKHTHNIDSLNLPTAVGIGIFSATQNDF